MRPWPRGRHDLRLGTAGGLRLHRTYGDRYLAAGKSGGRFPIESPDQLTDRERRKIERLSHKWGVIAVLDEAGRTFGHFALDGPFAYDQQEAFSEDGDLVLDTELCTAYPIAFYVERGRWVRLEDWLREKQYDGPPFLVHLLDGPRSLDDVLGL